VFQKDISRHFNKASGEKYPEESNAPHVGAFFFAPKTRFLLQECFNGYGAPFDK